MAENRYYKLQVKREVADALRDTIKLHPDTQVRTAKVHTQFPNVEEQFPAVYIQFSEGTIRSAGVGHYEIAEDNRPFRRWQFTGQIAFTAISPISAEDRDVLAGAVMDIIAFGDMSYWSQKFHNDIRDEDFIRMILMKEEVTPGGEGTMQPPWNANSDQLLFTGTYQADVFGEFFSDRETGELIEISRIDIYPYLQGAQRPTGSTDSRDADIPWY
jgi:hypothetical protein